MSSVKVYHGSYKRFSKFDTKYIGSNAGTSGGGYGFYFTDNIEQAMAFGNFIYSITLKLKKSLSAEKVTLSKPQLVKILEKFEAEAGNSYIEAFDGNFNNAIESLLEYNDDDADVIADIINATGEMTMMFEVLSKLGYTHFTQKQKFDIPTMNYIVFDTKAIYITGREDIVDVVQKLGV